MYMLFGFKNYLGTTIIQILGAKISNGLATTIRILKLATSLQFALLLIKQNCM